MKFTAHFFLTKLILDFFLSWSKYRDVKLSLVFSYYTLDALKGLKIFCPFWEIFRWFNFKFLNHDLEILPAVLISYSFYKKKKRKLYSIFFFQLIKLRNLSYFSPKISIFCISAFNLYKRIFIPHPNYISETSKIGRHVIFFLSTRVLKIEKRLGDFTIFQNCYKKFFFQFFPLFYIMGLF